MLTLNEEYVLSTLEEVGIKSNKENCRISLVKDSVDDNLYIKKAFSDKSSLNVHKTLKAVKHKNLPTIFHVIESETGFVVIEEYIHGETLRKKIDNKPLSESQVMDYAIQLCEILKLLHNMKPPIIHRDIKPSNVLCSNDGVIKLIDFDAAKELNALASEDTVTLGTKAFAAPEQFGYAKADNKTDIYCLGAAMFQLLTGKLFIPKSNLDLYNGALKDVIKKCVQIDPDNRYKDIEGLKEDLAEIKTGKKKRAYVFPDLKTAPHYKKSILIVFYIILTFAGVILTAGLIGSMEGNYTDTILTLIMFILFLAIPYCLICNIFGARDRIPLFHKKTVISNIIGIIITAVLLCGAFFVAYALLDELKPFLN